MPVDRPDVAHAERLEERGRLEHLAHGRLDRLDRLLRRAPHDRDVAEEPLEAPLAAHVRRVQAGSGEGVRHPVADARDDPGALLLRLWRLDGPGRDERRHRRRVAAAVVVEDDDDAAPAVAEVVECLVRHPAGHRSVTDDGDDVTVGVGAGVACDGEPVGVGEHRRGVAVLDVVVLALGPTRVPGQTPGLAQAGEPVAPSGHELVDVCLMAGVPQNRVGRRLEHAVHGERELHGPEVRSQVAAVLGDREHDEVPDLARQLLQLVERECPQVGRLVDAFEPHGEPTLSGPAEVRGIARQAATVDAALTVRACLASRRFWFQRYRPQPMSVPKPKMTSPAIPSIQ